MSQLGSRVHRHFGSLATAIVVLTAAQSDLARAATFTPTPCINTTITTISPSTALASADKCGTSNSFFATGSDGGIALLTGGSPNFASPGFSNVTVYNPPQIKAPSLNAIASECCMGVTQAWAVGANHTVLFNSGLSGPTTPWVVINIAGLIPPSTDFLGVDVGGCGDVWITGTHGVVIHHLAGNPPTTGWVIVNPPSGPRLPNQDKYAIKRIPANFFGLGCPSSTWIMVAGKATGGTNDQIYLSTDGGLTFFAENLGAVTFNSGTTLRALDVLNNGSVYAVGDNGVIMWGTINGTCSDFIWTQQASGTTAQLNAINGSSPGGLLVAGNNGTFAEFNGSVWTSGNIGSNINLSAVGQDTSGNGFVTCQCMVVVSIVCPPFFLPPQITNSPTFTDTPTPTPPVTATSTYTETAVIPPSLTPTFSSSATPGGASATLTPFVLPTSSATSSATPMNAGSPGITLLPSPIPDRRGTPGPPCCGNNTRGIPTLVRTITIPPDLGCPNCGPPGPGTTNVGEGYLAIANIICHGKPGTWAVGRNGVVRLWYGGTFTAYTMPFPPGPLPDFTAVTVPQNGVVWIGGTNGQIYMGTAVGNSCTDYVFVQEPNPNPNMRITNIQVNAQTGLVVITGVDQITGKGLTYSAALGGGGGVATWSNFLNLLPINPPGLNHVLETTPGNYWMVGNAGLILNDPDVNNPLLTFTAPPGLPATVQVGVGTTVAVPLTSIDFRDVEAVSPNELYIVGTQGVVLQDLSGVWTQIAIGETISNLNKIAIDANNEIVFVGDNGTVLTFNGTTVYCLCQGLSGSDNILDICRNVVCMGGFLTYINPSETLCGFIATPPPLICENIPATFQLEYVESFVLVPTFTGVVSLSDANDPATVFNPNPVIFTPADNGVVTFQATFSSIGNHRVYFTSNMCTVPNFVDVMVDHCYTATSTITPTDTATPTHSPTATATSTLTASPTQTSTSSITPSFSVSGTFTSTFTVTPTPTITPTVCIACGVLPQNLTLGSITNCPPSNEVIFGPLCAGSYVLKVTSGAFVEGPGPLYFTGVQAFVNSTPSMTSGGYVGCVGEGGFGMCGVGSGPGPQGSWPTSAAALAAGMAHPLTINITAPFTYLVLQVGDNGGQCSDNQVGGMETFETLELSCSPPTPTVTDTPSCTRTITGSATSSSTRTNSPTSTATSTNSSTRTDTPTFTISSSRTQTRTSTSTSTASPSRTASATATATPTCGIPAGSACCFTQPALPAPQQLPGMTLPVSVATDCGGFVYAIDATGVLTGVIRKFDSSGNPVATAPFPIAVPYVDFSTQIAFDCVNDRILVTDPSTGNVLRFDATTGASLPAYGPFPNIVGLAVDASGNIYVGTGDGVTGAVTSLTSGGVLRWATPLTAGSGAAFQYPASLAVDSVNHVLYVSDNGTGFIQSFGNINTPSPSTLFNISGFGSSTSAIAWNPLNNVLLVAQISIAPPFSTLDPNLNMLCGGFVCFTGPRGGRSLAIGPFNGYAYAIFDTECCPNNGASIWVPCALPPTMTATVTPTPSSTSTRTSSITFSATPTGTSTATASPTFTTSATANSSATGTPTFTGTPSFSVTSSATPTATHTPTFTGTPTFSVTSSGTPTLTVTPSATASSTATETPIPPACAVCPSAIAITTVSIDPNATPGAGEQCIIVTADITGPTGCQITLEAHPGSGLGNTIPLGVVTLGVSPDTRTFFFCSTANNLVISAVLNGSRCIDSNQVSLAGLPLGSFQITAWDPPAAGPITVSLGEPFSLSVTALNSQGGVMKSYAGTTHFSIVPAAGTLDTLPPDTGFSANADHGMRVFFNQCSISTAGTYNIVVNDVNSPQIQGTSNLIIVGSPTTTQTQTPVVPSPSSTAAAGGGSMTFTLGPSGTPTPSMTPSPSATAGAGGSMTLTSGPSGTSTTSSTPSATATTTPQAAFPTPTPLPASACRHINCYQYLFQWGSLGSGSGQFGFPDGVAVAKDGTGDVYVADENNTRVEKFDANGHFILQFGTPGSGPGQFQTPFGIGTDYLGHIYVTDGGSDRVERFDNNGNYQVQWGSTGTGPGQFQFPQRVASDTAGHVFVTDGGNSRVEKFDVDGNFISQWGGAGAADGQFSGAFGLAVDLAGTVYVGEINGTRIQKFDNNGVFIAKWNSQFNSPRGLSVDSCPNVYLTDLNGQIQKFSSTGKLITTFGMNGSGNGQFNEPLDIAVTSDGTLAYISDTFNNRVQVFGVCSLTTPMPTPAAMLAAPLGSVKQVVQVDPYSDLLTAEKPVITVPNPAKNDATVAYRLESPGKVRLFVTTLDGNVVMTLTLGDQPAGIGTENLYLGNLSSGLYFAVLQVDEGLGFKTKKAFKMAVVK